MNEDQDQGAVAKEDPKVFRVAQLPGSNDAHMDRRSFVKGTVTAVGAGSAIALLGGCEGDDGTHPFVEAEGLPGMAGVVQPGESGINITSATGQVRTMPCGSAIPAGWTCTCNCVTVPSCTCNGHCSCNGQSSHYWYPC
jgi:hypothetical protein